MTKKKLNNNIYSIFVTIIDSSSLWWGQEVVFYDFFPPNAVYKQPENEEVYNRDGELLDELVDTA